MKTPTIFSAQNIHLTGIKGVAMTSLAQCLVDMGKTVTGSDVEEDFVTKNILDKLSIQIKPLLSTSESQSELNTFNTRLATCNLLIYTAAHGGPNNQEVKLARENNIPVLSHAKALAQLFNAKKGIAICGVGGKSTVSAMITWILEKTGHHPSFSVGVGKIIGLDRTGKWNEKTQYFVAEADEYVTDPSAVARGEEITPRFTFMKPHIIVCTNLRFDHPDVYQDFAHTQRVFKDFFSSLPSNGLLIMNEADQITRDTMFIPSNQGSTTQYFGENSSSDIRLVQIVQQNKSLTASFEFDDNQYQLQLSIPGKFNVLNALASIMACHKLGISIQESITALSSFQSTQRRFEFKGVKDGVKYYDDYAHHPSEITATTEAIQQWLPSSRIVLAFQPHTFSRTMQLFDEFVDSFANSSEVVLLDIFASAREQADSSITSDDIVTAVQSRYPDTNIQNVHTIEALANFCNTQLHPGDVLLTVGAGDIYKVHEMIKNKKF